MPAHMQIRALGPQFAPAWHRPQFRYIDPVPGAESGTNDGTNAGAANNDGGDLGFPKDTPLDQMTPEQEAAYWKHQSKVQQKKFEAEEAKNKAAAKAAADAADAATEQARLAALDENQRAIETSRSEGFAAGKADGLLEGSSKHLDAAVKGMLIALTKGASEPFEDASDRVSGAIEFADMTKFIGDDGELDAAKVQTFAKSIGSADSGGTAPGGFPLFDAMQRQTTPAPGATGSVAVMEQQVYDRIKPKQQ